MTNQTIEDLYQSIHDHELSWSFPEISFGECKQRVEIVINDLLLHNKWNIEITNRYPISFIINSVKAPEYGLSIACPQDRPDIYCETIMIFNDEEVYNDEYANMKSMYSWNDLEKELDRFFKLDKPELSIPHPFSLKSGIVELVECKIHGLAYITPN